MEKVDNAITQLIECAESLGNNFPNNLRISLKHAYKLIPTEKISEGTKHLHKDSDALVEAVTCLHSQFMENAPDDNIFDVLVWIMQEYLVPPPTPEEGIEFGSRILLIKTQFEPLLNLKRGNQ